MRLVFLGAPGVGKGTQADRITAQFGWPKISTGDLLREAVRNQTSLGVEAKKCMDAGKLVPDSVVINMVRAKLVDALCRNGFILMGFQELFLKQKSCTKSLMKADLPLTGSLIFGCLVEISSNASVGDEVVPNAKVFFT